MERLIKAFGNSRRAFNRLIRSEAAFQQEIILLALSIPVALLIASTWRSYALLVGAVLFLILVEVLNSGIEAACDAVSREFDSNIQLAKDCGSLAVLIAIFIAATIWVIAFVEWIAGLPA